MSNGSHHRYRIRMRPGPGGKLIPWLQQQLFGFLWWRWWEPIYYRRRAIEAEIVECHRRILELIPDHEDAKKDEERAQKEVDKHNPDKGVGKPFLAPHRPRRGDIPSYEEDVKKVVDLYAGLSQGRQRFHGGTRSMFVPERFDHLKSQVVEGETIDHFIGYRKPNQGNQQGQGKQKHKHGHQGGGQQNQQHQDNQS